jgi:hypothetical protein
MRHCLHVVGAVTDEIASLLGPLTSTLAARSVAQSIVLIDRSGCRHNLAALSGAVELVLVPESHSALSLWLALARAVQTSYEANQPDAMHLHGVRAWLATAGVLRRRSRDIPVYFSPHSSRLLTALLTKPLPVARLLRPILPSNQHIAIVNLAEELSTLPSWPRRYLIESPVDPALLGLVRNESRHPLVIAGGRGQDRSSASRVAQLAVLMSGRDDSPAFNWMGPVDAESSRRLDAAGVGVFEGSSDAELAMRLTSGWIYHAPGGVRGFPIDLVNAMAAGLPVVAFDSVEHREVIRHGESGLLYRSQRDAIEQLSTLLGRADERRRLGQAAREICVQRFGHERFEDRVLRAYGIATPDATPLADSKPAPAQPGRLRAEAASQ